MDGLEGLAAPPEANGELVFEDSRDPRLFGLARALCEAGVLEQEALRRALVDAIDRWEALPADERGPWRYWDRFQEALEAVLEARGLVPPSALEARTAELAARPHGHDHDRARDPGLHRGHEPSRSGAEPVPGSGA